MNIADFLAAEFDEHDAVVRATRGAVAEPFERLLAACTGSLRAGGKILFFGNGGSAADAQHLATELAVRYKKDRNAITPLALHPHTTPLPYARTPAADACAATNEPAVREATRVGRNCSKRWKTPKKV